MSKDRIENIKSLINGAMIFLKKNTGKTERNDRDFYLINPEGVVANNRHYMENDTRQEGIFEGNSPSESLTVHILGLLHAYWASGNRDFIELAKWHFKAHVDYYHIGIEPPKTPQRWPCNWVVNGKAPVLANYPINPDQGTQGGFKCVPVRITNGKGKIPQGAPYWGEYMDVIMFAHRGLPGWEAINATMRKIKEDVDGLINWDDVLLARADTPLREPYHSRAWVDWDAVLGHEPTELWGGGANAAREYPVEWVNVHTGWKIGIGDGPADQDWDGEKLEEVPFNEIGEFELKDKSINGVYFINYATANPVSKGGYLVGRNEVWHNRPIMTPLINHRYYQIGDASDAQVWLLDCCYMLWRATGEDYYYNALMASFYTSHEYTLIDFNAKFFRQSKFAETPFTDGISYDYTSGSEEGLSYDRDESGFIIVTPPIDERVYLEQQAIHYKVNHDSQLFVSVSMIKNPLITDNESAQMYAVLTLSDTKGGSETEYITRFDPLSDRQEWLVSLRDLKETYNNERGEIYFIADNRAVWLSGATHTVESGGDGYDLVGRVQLADDSSQAGYGFWLGDSDTQQIREITFKGVRGVNELHIIDSLGWRWHWVLSDGETPWTRLPLLAQNLVLNSWQPNDGEPPYDHPPAEEFYDQVVFRTDSEDGSEILYYCINEQPKKLGEFNGAKWTGTFTLVLNSGTTRQKFKVGDCKIKNYDLDSLNYTPGTIPFSNPYEVGSTQIGDWRGLPYDGYQWPMMYCIQKNHELYERWRKNQIDFLYDAQQAYLDEFGELGPTAAAYIWDRPDATSYGPANTWTFNHWGDDEPWAGYRPRAFCAAARGVYELSIRNRGREEKLTEFCANWINWLKKYIDRWGRPPTSFPSDENAYDVSPGSINTHMAGLWLAGTSYMLLSDVLDGQNKANAESVAELVYYHLKDNQIRIEEEKTGSIMNGSWTDWSDPNGDGGQIWGFHIGEVLRGLSLYLMYLEHGGGYNMFKIAAVSDRRSLIDGVEIIDQ